MSLIQIEQERPGLWKAEVEAVTGFGTARRVMLHAPTFDGVRGKVVEAYRTMVPPPAAEPSDAQDAPEPSEAGETGTGYQATSAERPALTFSGVADAYVEPAKRGPGRPRKQQ
jgi:hypothetical protein